MLIWRFECGQIMQWYSVNSKRDFCTFEFCAYPGMVVGTCKLGSPHRLIFISCLVLYSLEMALTCWYSWNQNWGWAHMACSRERTSVAWWDVGTSDVEPDSMLLWRSLVNSQGLSTLNGENKDWSQNVYNFTYPCFSNELNLDCLHCYFCSL